MIVESKVVGGHLPNGKVLLKKGRNEFEFRSLFRGQREYVRAMEKARLLTVIEEDAPADDAVVIPFPAPVPATAEVPVPAESAPMKRRGGAPPVSKPRPAPKKRAAAKASSKKRTG